MRLLASAALALVTAGCYNSAPITVGTVSPTRDVELYLNDRGVENLAALLGPGTVSIKARPVAGPALDSLRIGVIQTTLASGEERLWKREVVGVSHADIARVTEYRLSASKTAVIVAAVVAGAVVTRMGAVAINDSRKNRPRPTGQ